jgi:acyl dehydratase
MTQHLSPLPTAASLFDATRCHIGYSDEIALGAIHRREFQRFAVAVGDFNPIYFDEDAARASGHAGLVVPPMFLSAVMGWGAGPAEGALREDGLAESDSFLIPVPGLRLMGGGQEIEWHSPLLEGVQVTLLRTLENVRLRDGRTGPMVLLIVRRRYVDAGGRLLASCRETFIGR